jgi:hypothetical protein
MFFITKFDTTKISVIEIKDSGSHSLLPDINPNNGLAIQSAKCLVFNLEVHCIIQYLGHYVGDIVFTKVPSHFEIKTNKKYSYFYNYRPVYYDFDTNYLVLKARSPTKEVMLIYNRATEDETLFWGLTPGMYYDKQVSQTNSLPLVVTYGSETKIAFTQDTGKSKSMMLRKVAEGDRGTFFQTEFSKTILTLSENLNENEVKDIQIWFNADIGTGTPQVEDIMNFFNKSNTPPAPTSATSATSGNIPNDDIPWWVWVIIGMVIFLIFVAFLLKFLTREKDDIEEEEDVYYDTKAREAMAAQGN